MCIMIGQTSIADYINYLYMYCKSVAIEEGTNDNTNPLGLQGKRREEVALQYIIL